MPTNETQTTQQPGKRKLRRRSRLWRMLKWTLLSLLILIVLLVALVAWVAGTDSGTGFAWNRLKGALPGNIRIESVDGRLIGPLHVRGIRYKTENKKIRIQSVDFNMDATDLLSLTVHIKNLAVSGVTYKVTGKAAPKAGKKAKKPRSLPKLPVTVQIDRVALDNVTAITSPGAKPIVLRRARLKGAHLDSAQWHIQSFTANGPLFDVEAHARVSPRGDHKTYLTLQASLRPANLAPIQAQATAKGSLKDLQLKARVAKPYNVQLAGHVKHVLKKPEVNMKVHVRDLRTRAIRDTLPRVTVDADVTARGPLDHLALTATSHVDSPDYGQVNLDGALDYTPSAVDIVHLDIKLPATGGALTVQGQVALAQGHAMDLAVHWSDLSWPLSGQPAYQSQSGDARLTGTLKDYQLETTLTWQVAGQSQGKLMLRGNGSPEAFHLTKLDVSGGPGHITGHAKARWSPALEVAAHLQGSHINPGAILAKAPGDFSLVVDVNASRKNGVLNAQVRKLEAHGSLRHQPLDLNAKLAYTGDEVKIDTLHLATGSTTADVSGLFGWKPDAKLNGKWSIHAPDLSSLLPTIAGSIQSEGQVQGSVSEPELQIRLKASDIKARDNRVKQVRLRADVDWSGESESRVRLTVDGVDAAGQKIKQVTVDLDGTPAEHRLSVKLDSARARASVAMDGHLDKKTYKEQFTLKQLRAAYGKLAPWKLESPASGVVSAREQSIENACLASGDARLCITGSHDAKASEGHIRLSDFPYDYAQPFFPEKVGVTGSISGTVDARLPAGGAPDIGVDLHTTAGHVSMTTATGKKVRVLDMQPGRIRAKMQANGLDAHLDLPLNGGSGVQAQVNVASGKGALIQHALKGRLRLRLPALDFIEKLSPEVAEFDGHIQGDLHLSGTVAEPGVQGKMEIDAGKIVLVTPGLKLTQMRLTAIGHGNRIAVQAEAHSGGGSLKAGGRIALEHKGQQINLHLQGDHFQIANMPQATAYVSPDLKVRVTPAKVDVTGKVVIPEAAITPRNLPASGVTTPSGDQVIVTRKSAGRKAAERAVHADITVVFGKQVHVDAFGLKSDLEGRLRVVQQPGHVPTGSGAINLVNGSYKAYGQNLDIQEGKILFSGGPVSKPGLDFRAARYPNDDVTVGVEVRGTLKMPEVTLFSQPSMTQAEILSWLLLGRPLHDTNGRQASLVTRAALALGSGKGNEYLQSIGDKLGVNLGIGAAPGSGGAGKDTSATSTALKVGKYLTPRLYVSYGLGLFDQLSTVAIRYTLSSHWQLKSASSTKATGGDIIFNIDR